MNQLQNQFPDLNNADLLKEIEQVSETREVKTGQVLMEVGNYIKYMPLVLSGVIKIIRQDDSGKEILLYYLEGGKTCAMSMTCCMQAVKSNIRATVEEDASLIMIPVKYVDEWMMKYPSWKNFIMNTFTNRFDQLLKAIDDVSFKKMDERLLHYITEKIQTLEEDFVSTSKTDIASDLGTSREVISRIFKKLEIDGKIKIVKGKVFLT